MPKPNQCGPVGQVTKSVDRVKGHGKSLKCMKCTREMSLKILQRLAPGHTKARISSRRKVEGTLVKFRHKNHEEKTSDVWLSFGKTNYLDRFRKRPVTSGFTAYANSGLLDQIATVTITTLSGKDP